jgi:tetratricopeptide (TPR) repeat protein
MGFRGWLALASAVFALAVSGVAVAKPDAKSSFDEGLAHFKRHEYSDAAESFFRAYRISPTADALYNAGLAWELAGDAASAATAYEIARTLDLPPKAMDDTKARLGRLAVALGRIEVSAPEGATLEAKPFVVNAAKGVFYFDPGRHTIGVTLQSGRHLEKSFVARAGQTTVVLVETSTPSTTDTSEPEPVAPPPPKHDTSSSTPWHTVGWVSLGASAVASAAAIYFGVETLRARDDYNASPPPRSQAERDRAENLMHWTNIAWATAAVTGAAGAGILLFAPADGTQNSAFSPRIVVRGRF